MPDSRAGVPLPFDLSAARSDIERSFTEYDVKAACYKAMEYGRAANKWLTELEPWKMKDPSQFAKRDAVVRLLLEVVYVLAHFFAPFLPVACTSIFLKLNTPGRPLPELSVEWANLTAGAAVTDGPWPHCGETLFPKLPPPVAVEEAKPPAAAAPAAAMIGGAAVAELEAQVAAQGTKVRALKEAKAQKDEVQAAVDALLRLKKELAAAQAAAPAKKAAAAGGDPPLPAPPPRGAKPHCAAAADAAFRFAADGTHA